MRVFAGIRHCGKGGRRSLDLGGMRKRVANPSTAALFDARSLQDDWQLHLGKADASVFPASSLGVRLQAVGGGVAPGLRHEPRRMQDMPLMPLREAHRTLPRPLEGHCVSSGVPKMSVLCDFFEAAMIP